MQRPRASSSGYTLMEIVISITILAILLAIGLTILSRGKANRMLDGCAESVTSELKYARSLAMNTGGATVTLSTSTGVISITNGSGQLMKQITLPANVALTLSGVTSPLTFNANGTTSAGTVVVTSTDTGRAGTITLSSAGTVSVSIH